MKFVNENWLVLAKAVYNNNMIKKKILVIYYSHKSYMAFEFNRIILFQSYVRFVVTMDWLSKMSQIIAYKLQHDNL